MKSSSERYQTFSIYFFNNKVYTHDTYSYSYIHGISTLNKMMSTTRHPSDLSSSHYEFFQIIRKIQHGTTNVLSTFLYFLPYFLSCTMNIHSFLHFFLKRSRNISVFSNKMISHLLQQKVE